MIRGISDAWMPPMPRDTLFIAQDDRLPDDMPEPREECWNNAGEISPAAAFTDLKKEDK